VYAAGSTNCGAGEGGTHHTGQVDTCWTRTTGKRHNEDVQTTEGEGVDFLGELLELSGWTLVDDDETEPDLS
jgi:hypothetical protein